MGFFGGFWEIVLVFSFMLDVFPVHVFDFFGDFEARREEPGTEDGKVFVASFSVCGTVMAGTSLSESGGEVEFTNL